MIKSETKTPAVAYIRCSTEKQADTSLDQQRKDLAILAEENGYEIIRWYEEEPKSGDDAESRPVFLKMLSDAVTLSDFDVLLAWEPSRIGRFSMNEAGHRFYPLEQAGVVLHTRTKGLLPWDSLELIISTWQSRQEQRTRVARTTRACREYTELGRMVAGVPPFGYKKVGTRKNYRYEPHPDEAPIVRELFTRRAVGQSLVDLSDWLNGQGIKTRRGNAWTDKQLGRSLKNRAYLGIIERKSEGSKHSDEAWHVVAESAHEPLVDQATFDRCEDLQRDTKPTRRSDYALTGACICPGCGQAMKSRQNAKGEASYVCTTYHETRRCERYTVDEKPLVAEVVKELRRELLKAEAEGRFTYDWDSFRKAYAARAGGSKKRIAMLDGEIKKIVANMVKADPDMLPHFQAAVREKEQERREAIRTQPAGDMEEQIQLEKARLGAAISALLTAGELVEMNDTKAIRELFKCYGVTVYPTIKRVKYGKVKARCELVGGTVTAAFQGVSPEFMRLGDAMIKQIKKRTVAERRARFIENPELLTALRDKVLAGPSNCRTPGKNLSVEPVLLLTCRWGAAT